MLNKIQFGLVIVCFTLSLTIISLLEAVPTAFLFSVLVISGLGAEDGKLNGLRHLLVGSWESNWVDIDQFILFCISLGSSVFSAVFGISR